MSRTEKFFHAMAWLLLGVVIGFLIAPIKGGANISICSNNAGADFGGPDDGEDEAGGDGEPV